MIHVTLLPTGKVLFWNNPYMNDPSQIAKAYLWDPGNPGSITNLDPPYRYDSGSYNNIFCAGHILTPNGRVLVTTRASGLGGPL